VRMSKL